MISSMLRQHFVASNVLLINIERPEVRNALSTPLLKDLCLALAEADKNQKVGALVLTGGPKVFAAGADLQDLAAHDAVSVLTDERPELWRQIRNFSKPLIAAVNGLALGAGCELALHADIIIAGETARFGQPEINLGIIPGAGGTQRLTQAVGKSIAMKMVLAGEWINAQQALEAGLVAEITEPDVTVDRAVALAAIIGSKPPLALRLAKQAVLKSFEVGLEQGLAFERQAFCQLFATHDAREGIEAFLDKRQPIFEGR